MPQSVKEPCILASSVTRQITVKHPDGLHLRPCAAIVKTVSRSKSRVQVRYANREADASEIFGLLCMGVPQGAEVTLLAQGPDSEAVLDAVLANLWPPSRHPG